MSKSRQAILLTGLSVLFASELGAEELKTIASQDLPIRVLYATDSQEPLAQAALKAGEHAWKRQVLDMGYPAPWTGSKNELRQGMDISLESTGMGADAAKVLHQVDVPSTPQCDCSCRIVVDKDTSADSPSLTETVFHEFHHTTEYATDCTEAFSAFEMFTLAAVHNEFPQSPVVPHVIALFQKFPEYPLDYVTMNFSCMQSTEPCFGYLLGSLLFPTYLMERFADGNPLLLRDLFNASAQDGTTYIVPPAPKCSNENQPDWWETVSGFVASKGTSFDEAFAEFSAWRAIVGPWDDGKHYAHGASYPPPKVVATHLLEPSSAGQGEVREYGTQYVEWTPTGNAQASDWRFSVSGSPEASWAGSVLVWPADTSSEVRRYLLGFEAAEGHVDVPSLDNPRRIVLAVSQLSDGMHDVDDSDFDNARSFSYRLETIEFPPDAGAGGQGAAGAGDSGRAGTGGEPNIGGSSGSQSPPVGEQDAGGTPALGANAPLEESSGCSISGSTGTPLAWWLLIGVGAAWRKRRSRLRLIFAPHAAAA